MEKQKETKNNNSRLSLYPLEFEEAAKAIVKVKPDVKNVHSFKATEGVETK